MAALARVKARKTFGSGQEGDAAVDPVGGDLGVEKERLAGLDPLGVVEVGEGLALVFDPVAVLVDEAGEGGAGGVEVGEGGEGLHAEGDAVEPGGLDALDLGGGDPGGADLAAAAAVVHEGDGGDVVADGELAGVAVLEVGGPLVVVAGAEAAEVGAGGEALGAAGDQLGLEGEAGVLRRGRPWGRGC